jgi:hypothetical protein
MFDCFVASVANPGCYPGSRIRLFSIPDPNCLHPGPGSSSKNLSLLTPKKPKKWFLSSRKYDPVCSSRIRMLTFYPSRIPDPGVKKAPDPGSGSATNTVCSPCSTFVPISQLFIIRKFSNKFLYFSFGVRSFTWEV